MVSELIKPIKVFYSYHPKDSHLRAQLEKHLSPLRRKRDMTGWFDRDILAGTERSHEIEKHLEEADIILLLVSPDFIASNYHFSVEMHQALKMFRDGKTHIVPILLRPVDWQSTPLGTLKVLPANELPVTSWSDFDQAFYEIAQEIKKLIETLLEKRIVNQFMQKQLPSSSPHPQESIASDLSHHQPLGDLEINSSSEESTAMPENQIISPSLMIFLGGSAALASLELLQHLLSLTPQDRSLVAFVYIDTDDMPSSLLDFRKQYGHLFRIFSLHIRIPPGLSIMHQVNTSDQHMFIREIIPHHFAHGTNRVRNTAHVAACFQNALISNFLDNALENIYDRSTREVVVQVNIIAFLGGGTGSGIIPDIAVLMRELLAQRLVRQRLNIFGILPEQLQGIDPDELLWLKSNATACLLELVAFSCAAENAHDVYIKRMRDRQYNLTNDTIVNEVYLYEHISLASVENVLRAVGLDLFQRVTDASGVGYLEHSNWVDRHSLVEIDDRGIPTMFGTTCSFEVYFPILETAKAFAQISAARLLPLLKGLEFWFQEAEAEQYAKELEQKGRESKAWLGKLEHPHPYQRHIFDLDNFSKDQQNLAIKLLYLWSTFAPGSTAIDYSGFIDNCVGYLSHQIASLEEGKNWKQLGLDELIAKQLIDYIVGFFYDYYVKQFQQMNLFELLEKVTFLNESRLSRTEQISSFFSKHLENIRQHINPPISFDPELWQDGLRNLNSSFYLGIHWRNFDQERIFRQALGTSGLMVNGGRQPVIRFGISYHSLQISYGLHGISLSTIRDFYHDKEASAMEAYLLYQSEWGKTGTTLPVHSSGEAERLIKGSVDGESLVNRVVRHNFIS